MDRELKNRWIAALESGKYLKGQGYLCMRPLDDQTLSFCCLGVLADLIDPNGWSEKLHDLWYGQKYLWHGQTYFLYENDDLDAVSGDLLTNSEQEKLSSLNDIVSDFGPVIKYIKDNIPED